MKMRLIHFSNFFTLSLLFILTGCRLHSGDSSDSLSPIPKPSYKPVVIKSGVEDGHPGGIRLSIERTVDTDTTTSYTLISSYEGNAVGLIIVIPRKDNGKKMVSTAFLKSMGPPSDLFLKLLASQYQQHIDSSAKFADSIPFICMNLMDFFDKKSTTPGKDDWIAAEYKLFFDSENADGDAEMFMNINPDQQWVEFAEKDEDYRSHIISLFQQEKN
jgi:hypothetical protein